MSGRTFQSEQNPSVRGANVPNAKDVDQAALSAESSRLLCELGYAGRYATLDPTSDNGLILRCARAGVSLGGGRFPRGAAEELLRHDPVEEIGARSRPALRISEVGLARLKRERARPEHAFRSQHEELVEARIAVKGRKTTVALNAAESPLDWLRRRRGPDGEPLIDEACFQAGERLRRDLTFAAMLPPVTANWEGAVANKTRGGAPEPAAATHRAVAARLRVRQAFEALGPDFADLLIDLCGFLKGLEEIERDRSWPARSGKVVVKLALARLADHYGLERAAQGPSRSRGIRSWRESALLDALQ
jgi:hypothetical protein